MAPYRRKQLKRVKASKNIKQNIRRKLSAKRARKFLSQTRGQLPTPPVTPVKQAYRTAVQVASDVASSSYGTVAGMGTAAAGGLMEYIYDSYVGAKSASAKTIAAAASGRPTKAYTKKLTYKKKKKDISVKEIQKRGITFVQESRKVAVTNQSEALAIGHTTMPAKVCAVNLFRAIFKHLLLKAGVVIKDYGILAVNADFAVGDIIRVNRYTDGTATSTSAVTRTVAANTTLDELPYLLAIDFDDSASINDRWDSIEIVPAAGSKMPAVNVQLNVLKVSVFTKTDLKVQNVTTDNITDIEADDITRVPLQGKTYTCRGNNFCKKDNGPQLTGFFNTNNEEALYGAWTKQGGQFVGGSTIDFYGAAAGPSNSTETTFLKPAEPPRQYEIQNCERMGDLFIGPGEIKTSSMIQKFTFSVPYYIQMLYGNQNTATTTIIYNPKLGKTQVMYLEKVVGRSPADINSLRLWVELEFRQSVLVHGKAQNFTAPIVFQRDF